jgi:hypothetical protein
MYISRRNFLGRASVSAGACLASPRLLLGKGDVSLPSQTPSASPQTAIPYLETMPNIPSPFRVRDWTRVALELDSYAFDLNAKGPYLPLIWKDRNHANFDADTFGLFVSVDDPRCGPHARNGEFHLAIGDMPAVIGASLVGIDKSRQGGHNWVNMEKAFFNRANGNDVFMWTTQQDSARNEYEDIQFRDFWVDTLPSLLGAQMVHLYPQETQLVTLMRRCADQFCKAVAVLAKSPRGFHHQSFDFARMRPYDGPKSQHWVEPESSAGFAWLEYMAHIKFGDPRYFEAAIISMDALNAETLNPLYETMLPYGAYLAARLNAEHGRDYDTAKLLAWCFSGGRIASDGVSAARAGKYDMCGLWTMSGRAYLFETFQMASSLVPLVRYDQRFARAVGKWLLNAANSARLFYPDEIPDDYQAIPQLKSVSRNLLAYEVILRKGIKYLAPWEQPIFAEEPVKPFFATRDRWEEGRKYPPFAPVTHFSVYGSMSAGVFGGIISRTSDEKILCLDCVKTDYFHGPAYPTHLYFNPHAHDQEVIVEAGDRPSDLYDTVSKRWIALGATGQIKVRFTGDAAAVIVRIPAGASRRRFNGKLYANDIVVDHRA